MNNQTTAIPQERTSILPAVIEQPEPGRAALTLEEMALMEGEAGIVINQKIADMITDMREKSVAMTFPEDWVLFRRPAQDGNDGRVTAYLGDDGCQRCEDIWRVDVLPPGGATEFPKEEITDTETQEFAILITGDGYCKRLDKWVYAVEGVRRSDEDFVRTKRGIQKKVEVRKAAFKNLHGGIIRRMSGLSSLAASELERIWNKQGQGKLLKHCPQGRGFGGSEKRFGTGDVGDTPRCPLCKGETKLITPKAGASWSAFYACVKGKEKCKGSVKESDWKAELAKRPKPEAATAEEPPEQPREPGDEAGNEVETPQSAKNIGQRKNEALGRIKGKSYEAEIRAQLAAARTPDELTDLETLIGDREKENGK